MKNTVIFFLLCVVITNIVCIAISLNQYDIYSQAMLGNINMEDIKSFSSYTQSISILQTILYGIIFISFASWLYKVHEDLTNLQIKDLKYQHSQAFWAFCIPIINFVRPYFFAQEVWKASSGNEEWQKNKNSTAINLWWGFFVVGLFASYSSGVIIFCSSSIYAFQNSILVLMIADVLIAFSAVFAIGMIRAIEREQYKKYQVLQSREQTKGLKKNKVHN